MCIKQSMIMLLVLAQLAIRPSQLAAQRHLEEATVHIVVVDETGKNLGIAHIDSFSNEENRHQLSNRFRDNVATKVPYGAYTLKIHVTGFRSSKRVVYVFKSDVWVLVGLAVGEELPEVPSPNWPLSGTVKNFDEGEEPIYVRLVGLYSNYLIEDRLVVSGKSGTFTLAGLGSPGRFLLITIGRTRVLDIRSVVVPTKDPIMIDLAATSTGQVMGP